MRKKWVIVKNIFFFKIKAFMLGISKKFKISARLTLQVTTIIYHHMKKSIIKQKKKERKYKNTGLDQNSYINKNDT